MPIAWKSKTLLLALCAVIAVIPTTGAARPFAANTPAAGEPSSDDQEKSSKSDSKADSEEEAEEESAPAALEIDVSNSSPLIRELYQATRETKEKAILERLANAKKLLDDGTDVKATDAQGRTALHWTIFGSSYNVKTTILVAYEQIADALITRGVEINREDIYQDTALDYLLYSPSFEIQTLLIENGATSGFLAASFHFFIEQSQAPPKTIAAAVSLSRKADLAPGQDFERASQHSRLQRPIPHRRPGTATVTYPLCKNGEQMSCNPGELLIPPGTAINGTILFAQKAPEKYSRPRLVLDFSNVLHKAGGKSPGSRDARSRVSPRADVRGSRRWSPAAAVRRIWSVGPPGVGPSTTRSNCRRKRPP